MLTGLLRRNFTGASLGAVAATAAFACAIALSSPAAAAVFTDPANDILKSFSGDHNAADLDVTSASVTFSNNTFHLSATMAGDVRATTPGAIYVWGIDRGHGEAVLNQGANPVGAGVKFDTVAVFLPDGSVVLSRINTADGLFGGFIPLTDFSISGDTITLDLSMDLLRSLPDTDPATDLEEFRFNFWPRIGANVRDGREVSDFAPDDSTFTVPEPGSLALMVGGLALVGIARRRRSPMAEAQA